MPDNRLGRLIPQVIAAFMTLTLLVAGPVYAQTPSGSNPTAQAVNEQQLLDELRKIEGRVTLPNTA
ncbi:MAG: formate dehydrogenase subunit gamma, partial [Mesorhizobium sp.]